MLQSRGMRGDQNPIKPFSGPNISKFLIIVLTVALFSGIGTGYVLAKGKGKSATSSNLIDLSGGKPKTAEQDNRTFRDFAEGKITPKPAPKDPTEYTEGTHLLIRDGAQPVALTSSVVDLSEYEGKNVKVYGETQKALKEGWLMDVGRVEVK
jgi:hypothetical protein